MTGLAEFLFTQSLRDGPMRNPELVSVYISSKDGEVEEIYCGKMKEKKNGNCVLTGKWTPGGRMVVKKANIVGVRTIIRE